MKVKDSLALETGAHHTHCKEKEAPGCSGRQEEGAGHTLAMTCAWGFLWERTGWAGTVKDWLF